MKKVVFLTDVRYWRCRTGAQQRINALVQYMVRCGNEVTTLFAAPLLEEGGSKNAEKVCDHSLITNANLKVISLVDDWNPFGLAKKIKWQGKCILNALTSGLCKNDGGAENPNAKNQATLASLQTVEFVERVDEFLCRIDPDVVVVEYVTLAYLLPPLDSRRFLSVLDTHDLLASRCRQFEKLGHSHWLQITSEEEFAVFQRSIACWRFRNTKPKRFVTTRADRMSLFADIPFYQMMGQTMCRATQSIQSSKTKFRLGTLPPITPRTVMRCNCLLYTSPSPRDRTRSRMPSSA